MVGGGGGDDFGGKRRQGRRTEDIIDTHPRAEGGILGIGSSAEGIGSAVAQETGLEEAVTQTALEDIIGAAERRHIEVTRQDDGVRRGTCPPHQTRPALSSSYYAV